MSKEVSIDISSIALCKTHIEEFDFTFVQPIFHLRVHRSSGFSLHCCDCWQDMLPICGLYPVLHKYEHVEPTVGTQSNRFPLGMVRFGHIFAAKKKNMAFPCQAYNLDLLGFKRFELLSVTYPKHRKILKY